MSYEITIERTSDNRRFRRTINAATERDAVRKANELLASEPADYYVIDAKPTR